MFQVDNCTIHPHLPTTKTPKPLQSSHLHFQITAKTTISIVEIADFRTSLLVVRKYQIPSHLFLGHIDQFRLYQLATLIKWAFASVIKWKKPPFPSLSSSILVLNPPVASQPPSNEVCLIRNESERRRSSV